nr:MAG TPA: hypothetical protein [Bacteriophage sp.]
MATLPNNFIGKDALQHVAEQVSKEILMGIGYTDPAETDRLGIDIISGLQFKRTFHILLRKGGTTRRKDVHSVVNSQAGFLTERTLVARLAWDHFTDSIDAYCETVFGTDAQGQYPMATAAVEAVLRNYADNLAANFWFGDISLDDGKENVPAHDQALALYDGIHTCIKHDIEAGIISEANGNLIPCELIDAPADNNDSTPYDNFYDWYLKWDARLRKQKTLVYMNEITAHNIAAGYANKYHGNYKVDYDAGGNFVLPGMSKVTICPVSDFGVGDRMYATVPKNLVYGVDTLSNETYVGVKVGTDTDLRQIQLQIQSIQGAGIKDPYASSFAMSDGNLANPDFVAGDYTNSNLVVTLAKANAQDEGNIDGTVKVNGAPYKNPIETSVNQVISLEAADGTNYKFVNWSNGSTEKRIQLTATGMSMGLIAFFKKNG